MSRYYDPLSIVGKAAYGIYAFLIKPSRLSSPPAEPMQRDLVESFRQLAVASCQFTLVLPSRIHVGQPILELRMPKLVTSALLLKQLETITIVQKRH